jgi:lactoylglutathione lyase
VESLDATITELAARGVDADAAGSPDGSDDVRTTWITAADWPD